MEENIIHKTPIEEIFYEMFADIKEKKEFNEQIIEEFKCLIRENKFDKSQITKTIKMDLEKIL